MRMWLVLGLVACGGTKDPAGDSGTTVTDTPSGDTGTTDSPTDTAPPAPTADIAGTITLDGAPVSGAMIRCCLPHGLCYNATTEGNGTYSLPGLPPSNYAFEVVGDHSAGQATAFAPILLGEDEDRTLDLAVQSYEHNHTISAAAAEWQLGEGLYVTVGTDDLTPPDFVDPVDYAAGVRIPDADFPPMDWPELGTVVAAWYIDPFDFHAASGLPFWIDNSVLALPDGETYKVYVGEYLEAEWTEVGDVTVSGSTISGSGTLPLMSAIILVDPA